MADERMPQLPPEEPQQLTGQVEEAPPGPDEYMSEWGRRANALSEGVWKWCQVVLGVVLGLACAACLFFFQSDGFLPINFLVAFLLAKFGPDLVEKWFERKMPKVRIALLVALAVALVVYVVYNLALGQFTPQA